MAERKKIGLILANPEAIYQQRVMNGVFSSCNKYGYDVAVFCPLVNAQHYYRNYLMGELNIFELANFDKLDGVIIAPLTLDTVGNKEHTDRIVQRIKESGKPALTLDLPMADFEMICTDDRSALADLTEHIVGVHGCRDIVILAGMKDYHVTEERLAGIKDTYDAHGIPFDESKIFYGDFWYTGGEALGDKIISGEIPKPEAVIAISDHMAMGLANRLMENGIRVPEDIIITGFDCVPESAINTPSITSYVPAASQAARKAVARLHEMIEHVEPDPNENWEFEKGLFVGSSCGCHENVEHVKDALNSLLYNVNENFGRKDINYSVDIGRLVESYMFENLTAVETPDECLREIFKATYLIAPYERFYLCLCEDWLDTDKQHLKGYPERMKLMIRSTFGDNVTKGTFLDSDSTSFDTNVMLPDMWEEYEKPSVFYFAPVHFNEHTFGYGVLQCPLENKYKIGIVFRNWIRNVNNAIELTRVRSRLTAFSQRDAMTGLYNRRGMEVKLREMLERSDADTCLAFVIDMDGLKYINDHYGHSEGDFGINSIATAARLITRNDEICVRAGGDEFYIIGIGNYCGADMIARINKFTGVISEENKTSGKPYEISASIGGFCAELTADMTVNDIVQKADANMYENKAARKKLRR